MAEIVCIFKLIFPNRFSFGPGLWGLFRCNILNAMFTPGALKSSPGLQGLIGLGLIDSKTKY